MKTNYLGYIKRRIEKGKWSTSLNLYPNQIKKLIELGFIVTENRKKRNRLNDNEKCWCKVSCKNAKEGTYAHKLFSKAKDKKNMQTRKTEKEILLVEEYDMSDEENQ